MKLHGRIGNAAPRRTGFTLIEVMVAVAVVAILAAIATSFWGGFMTKGRRPDGAKLLLDAADRQEQYFFDHKAYTTDVTNLGFPSPATSENRYYTLTMGGGFLNASGGTATGAGCSGIAQCYVLHAAPTTGEPQVGDTECGTLRLDSRGAKWATGCDGKTGAALTKCLDLCW